MIRRYQDGDTDAVVAVWRAAADLAHPFLSNEFQDQEAENVRHVYPQHAEFWVKEIDDRIVGFIALIESEVGAIFLVPDYHGRGIGRELMDFAVERKGAVTLDVFKENAIGRRFYDAYGFKPVKEYHHEPSGQMMVTMAFDPD